MPSFTKGLALSALFLSTLAQAKPWIEPTDLHLRADLQLLANAGIITVPITTYPLMWKEVMTSINQHSEQAQSGMEANAIQRVQRAFKASQSQQVKLAAGLASEAARFQHFGTPMRESNEVTAAYSNSGNQWSVNLEATYSHDAQDGEDSRLDGSYLALMLGSWVISAGYQQQWYGPGWDSALTMSTNARPLPSLNLTRNSAEPFSAPVLKWFGPWTLTTGFGWMNDERFMDDTLLWTFRGTIKPHPNFEFGVSRAAQLCGSHSQSGVEKSCDLDTFWRVLIGDTNVQGEENPANQLASVDMRWGDTYRGVPYSIYWESMGEDAVRLDRFPPFQAKSYLYGADASYNLASQTITTFFEYSETAPHCLGINGNCAYEHNTYRSGYRYHDRVLASTYDNDAQTFTLGFVGFNNRSAHNWKANLRYLQLNKNGTNKNVEHGGGNKVSPDGEDTWNMDINYIFPIARGEVEVGAEYSYIQYRDKRGNDSYFATWMHWNYQF
ncbi:hypothetical protein BCU68_14760 [Vibrio sp. 10N.286.49.B3]|uniref:capsule assembly Wzi family protein n=1 Tax=Vibrio sp. 10N.286.49.B3 TaxID=1880855 RepID=UPI000CC89BCD|nr:capsule assembly Wzi family protein [Vibrio sp. 10N.286.49.B3]PMH42159.1 hypothetical protein BCU68_14760 [Vibrio sp. 10N.286.49.B3]